MPKVWKRERLIRNRLAIKKMDNIKKDIENWKIVIPEKKVVWMIPKYETPEEMALLIKEYVDEKLEKKEPLTISGLAKRLQVDIETLRNYSKKDAFLWVFKNMRLSLLESYEVKMLTDPKAFNALKYYLENNFSDKYSSKTTTDVNITGSVSLIQLNREAEKILAGNIVEGEIVQ